MQSNVVGTGENFRNNGPPPNLNGFGAPGMDSLAHYWSDQPPTQGQRMFSGEDNLGGVNYGGGEFRQRSSSGIFGASAGQFGSQTSLSKQQQWGQMGSVNQTTPWNIETGGGINDIIDIIFLALNVNCNSHIPNQWSKWDGDANQQQASSFQMRSIPNNNYCMPRANNFPQQQMIFGDNMVKFLKY